MAKRCGNCANWTRTGYKPSALKEWNALKCGKPKEAHRQGSAFALDYACPVFASSTNRRFLAVCDWLMINGVPLDVIDTLKKEQES